MASNLAIANSLVEAKNFMSQIDSLMNRRNMNEIKDFFNFYTNNNAVFIKQSYLIDSHDNDKVIASESLKMNLSDYLVYLKGILTLPKSFSYSSNLDTFKFDDVDKVAYITMNIKDSSLIEGYDINLKKSYTKYIITASTCNYALEYKNAHFYILGMNCAEKIDKTFQYVEANEVSS